MDRLTEIQNQNNDTLVSMIHYLNDARPPKKDIDIRFNMINWIWSMIKNTENRDNSNIKWFKTYCSSGSLSKKPSLSYKPRRKIFFKF